jgi:BON domain
MRRLFSIAAAAAAVLMAPAWAHADNQESAQQVANNLRASGRMEHYDVGVKVDEKTAWLNGTVASPEQMATALSIAQETNGIDRVVNNLTIGVPPSSAQNRAKSEKTARQANQAPQQLSEKQMVASAVSNSNSAQRGIVPAGMVEMQEQARQQMMANGPPASTDDDMPAQKPALISVAKQSAGRAPPAMFDAQGSWRMPNGQPMPMPSGQPMPMAMSNRMASMQMPVQAAGAEAVGGPRPMPAYVPTGPGAVAPYKFDHPQMPGYAWPSYAAYPNYAAVTYPKQYSPTAWPYIGPFYPYPQVPLGWRKVTLEWDDGWWFLDFKDSH